MPTPRPTPMPDFTLRPIRPEDDKAIAHVIRKVMPEFGASGPGFAIHDAEVDFMSRAYGAPRAAYFVLERAGRIVGGGGIGPLNGAPADVCELRKMYLLREARGHGQGRLLLQACLEAAREREYATVYLETLTGMDAARALYEQLGFQRLGAPMGATGHHGCNRYYALALRAGA